MNGKLVVLDGLDGSGKTTQQSLVLEKLRGEGISVRGISFPDYESPSAALVNLYLEGAFGTSPADVNPFAASSFYAVDRYAAYKTSWGADFHAGKLILAARYTSSNLFYQTEKLPRASWDDYIQWALDYEYNRLQIPVPDQVIFLDMPPEISKRLISERYGGDESKRDIHEQDTDYLFRCRESALYVCEKLGYTVVSCAENGEALPAQEITEKLVNEIRKVIEE